VLPTKVAAISHVPTQPVQMIHLVQFATQQASLEDADDLIEQKLLEGSEVEAQNCRDHASRYSALSLAHDCALLNENDSLSCCIKEPPTLVSNL
jgi:transcriptional regulator of aromatic amino acid metabolism